MEYYWIWCDIDRSGKKWRLARAPGPPSTWKNRWIYFVEENRRVRLKGKDSGDSVGHYADYPIEKIVQPISLDYWLMATWRSCKGGGVEFPIPESCRGVSSRFKNVCRTWFEEGDARCWRDVLKFDRWKFVVIVNFGRKTAKEFVDFFAGESMKPPWVDELRRYYKIKE